MLKFLIGLIVLFVIFLSCRFAVDVLEIKNVSYVFLFGYITGVTSLAVNLIITDGR